MDRPGVRTQLGGTPQAESFLPGEARPVYQRQKFCESWHHIGGINKHELACAQMLRMELGIGEPRTVTIIPRGYLHPFLRSTPIAF